MSDANSANSRIEQFRKMAQDDPSNELGHFSLGREYANLGQHEEAVESLRRAVAINPNLTKAYQLIGTSLLALNRRDQAVQELTEGVKRADARGDLMPRNEMMRMLTELGAPVPEVKTSQGPIQAVGEGEVHCKRCGRAARRLAKPPFRNAFGQEIYENICADCWQEAIRMGTKVINELRLPMNDPQAQKMWDQHIREFLNLQG